MGKLTGKYAVVTGAGKGIGRAIAEKLASCKMKIVLLGGNNCDKLSETRQIVEKYSEAAVIPGDLSDDRFPAEAAAKAACKAAIKAHDELTVEGMYALIEQLKLCRQGTLCPHGRPTLIDINMKEIERRFGRR